jgi:hypothetical protein
MNPRILDQLVDMRVLMVYLIGSRLLTITNWTPAGFGLVARIIDYTVYD